MVDQNSSMPIDEKSNDTSLENLTKTMLKAINKSKSSANENFNPNELKKTIKDIIETSELNDENK
jgi:hypothetical protein|uniref:hypothetical protein n=1 Tax=Flavobacterium sp. TaxID=239 RepID=UPI0040470F45